MNIHLKAAAGRNMRNGRTRDAGNRVARRAEPFEWRWGRRGADKLFRRRTVDDAGVDRLLGVVDSGRCVVDHLVLEAFEVRVASTLDRVGEELVDTTETKTKGK